METIEISGKPGEFRLVLRNFDGIETNKTRLASLTDDEAYVLMNFGYCDRPYGVEPKQSRLDIRDILKVETITEEIVGRTFVYDQLTVCLPANVDLRREEKEIVDPWYGKYIKSDPKWEVVRVDSFEDDSLCREEPSTEEIQEWPDNPTEAVAFW